MTNSTYNTLLSKVSELNLISALRLAQSVEQPQYIPFFEVFTLDQIADYFKVRTTAVDSIYRSNRKWFENFTFHLSSKEVEPFAVNVISLTERWSAKKLTFANGVTVLLSSSKQLVFDARALIMFAIFLSNSINASGVSKQIRDKMFDVFFQRTKALPPLAPWFYYCVKPDDVKVSEEDDVVHYSSYLPKPCDFKQEDTVKIKLKAEGTSAEVLITKEITPKTTTIRRKVCGKIPVAQFTFDGNFLRAFESMHAASVETGTNYQSISNCCLGKFRQAGGFVWKYIDTE